MPSFSELELKFSAVHGNEVRFLVDQRREPGEEGNGERRL